MPDDNALIPDLRITPVHHKFALLVSHPPDGELSASEPDTKTRLIHNLNAQHVCPSAL